MTPKEDLINLMKAYNLKPNKFLGQNFLIDRSVLQEIITAADLKKNDTVLEVGPGPGILTEALAGQAGRVIAVEKDKHMAGILKKILTDKNIFNVEIVQEDILKFSISNYQFSKKDQIINKKNLNSNAPQPPLKLRREEGELFYYKLVANIPYYLTARLIRNFLEAENPPEQIILMVQKEVAQRICARPPKMSLLAVAVQFYAEPRIISYISKKSFWPQPKVDSAIINIKPHSALFCHSCESLPAGRQGRNPDALPKIAQNSGSRIKFGMAEGDKQKFFRVARAGFAHPRKQLINNLSQGLKISREQIAANLKKIGLEPQQRAETLNVKDWINLTTILFDNHLSQR